MSFVQPAFGTVIGGNAIWWVPLDCLSHCSCSYSLRRRLPDAEVVAHVSVLWAIDSPHVLCFPLLKETAFAKKKSVHEHGRLNLQFCSVPQNKTHQCSPAPPHSGHAGGGPEQQTEEVQGQPERHSVQIDGLCHPDAYLQLRGGRGGAEGVIADETCPQHSAADMTHLPSTGHRCFEDHDTFNGSPKQDSASFLGRDAVFVWQ